MTARSSLGRHDAAGHATVEHPGHDYETTPSTRFDSAQWIPLIVERIVHDFHPLEIILFGSQARGDSRWDSDVDLLVVLPTVENKRRSAIQIMRTLRDLPAAVDVLVTTPDEIGRRGDSVDTVLRPALREGSVLYAAQR